MARVATTKRSAGNRREDFRIYKNADGFYHLEELLLYQPHHWKEFVRTYILKYKFKITSSNYQVGTGSSSSGTGIIGHILSHPDMATLQHQHFEALSLLLAYGAQTCAEMRIKHSPLHYYHSLNCSYNRDYLVQRSRECGIPRLALLEELTFSHKVVEQSMAKARIVQLLFGHFGHRHRMLNSSSTSSTTTTSPENTATADTSTTPKTTSLGPKGPLFLSLIGSRGTGKTALAQEVADLITHPDDDAVLFLQYYNATLQDGGTTVVTFQETKPVIREFVIRMLQRTNQQQVAVVILDGYSHTVDFRHDALDNLLLDIQSSVNDTAALLGNIIFIQTVSLSMDGYLESPICEISSQEARASALIKEMLTTETVQQAMGWSDPDHAAHAIVPFVPLTRDERIAKTKLLISSDTNGRDLSIGVRHRFAEYIADAYDYCDEALTSAVMQQEVDYWRLLAG